MTAAVLAMPSELAGSAYRGTTTQAIDSCIAESRGNRHTAHCRDRSLKTPQRLP